MRISDWSSDVCSSDLTDIIEYRNGNEEITVRKLPGLRKFTNITLKRGFTQSRELWEWRKKVMEGRTERKSGAIVLLNEAREPALRYEFIFGWPSKWMGPSLNASSDRKSTRLNSSH